MLMVFPFALWRFSGTINCPHRALAKAGDPATRDGHAPGTNLDDATPNEELPLEDPPHAAITRSKMAANGASRHGRVDRNKLLIPISEPVDAAQLRRVASCLRSIEWHVG
jgi:hypothetical protein